VLGVVILVLLALSLLPGALTRWVGVVRAPLMVVIAPIATPLDAFGGRLRPPREAVDPEEEMTREQLENAIAELERRVLTLRAENRELAELVEQLGRLRVATGVETRTVPATRVGSMVGSGASEFRPGARADVRVNAVAIAPGGLQIVGLVTRVSAMTSTVHLLTDTRFEPGLVVGVVAGEDVLIETTEQLDRLPRVQLEASGRGTLVAPSVENVVAERLREGDTVRVLDGTWPRAAQLLVLGRVVSITPTDEPLFKRVVVEPVIDPARVRSVLLRMPGESEGGVGG